MSELKKLSHVALGVYPTPLYKLENISAKYGRNIWVKRDDLCGVALGGNKVRKLEYLLKLINLHLGDKSPREEVGFPFSRP